MLELTVRQVRMGQVAADKASALRLVAQALHEDGWVSPGYLDGLQAREAQGSTFLGQGIAIPHGTPQTRDQVLSTGVCLLQFPEGVEWGPDQQVYLAIGIAAESDEHLHLLQILTRALGETDLAEALRQADSAEALVQVLHASPEALRLDPGLIGLGEAAEDFDELVWRGARLLRRGGCVDNGFAAVLQQVEALPLGEGLWWLHSEQQVRQPGLAFVTPARPLRHLGQPLLGLFCLASRGEAHRALLERLCEVLIAGHGQALGLAQDRQQVMQALGGEALPDWPTAQVRLANAHGLHARPAQQLAQLAKGFDGEIRVRLEDGPAVSAKSLSKLLSLGARAGQMLEFLAEPGIAAEALPALVAAVAQGLGEAVEALAALPGVLAVAACAASLSAPQVGQVLPAIVAAPGFAMGPVYAPRPPIFDFPLRGASDLEERQALQRALDQVRGDLQGLIARSEAEAIRAIFATHLEMLEDPALLEEAHRGIAQGQSAAAAWGEVVEAAALHQASLGDALLAERAADLRDLGRRVLAELCGLGQTAEPEQPYILVMDEVGPSDVARLDPRRVAGILTARGGATAHSAIVARALGIPALVGAGPLVLQLNTGDSVLLDGQRGRWVFQPDAQTLAQAERARERRASLLQSAMAQRFEPARTLDGHRLEVCANLGDSADAVRAVELGAEGVGLLRTEFLFMAHAQAPDLAIQEAHYRQVFDGLQGRPLVVRTLDVGGDKPLPYWPIPVEANPYLGLRGIRLCLQRPELLETQLRALLRAADNRPLRIMFPMVGGLDEWRQARDMVLRLRAEIPLQDLQLGIMVEVPSAALLAHQLAREVDFFSIGTNDLTQYCLAIDRDHPILSAQADGLHPAVLQLIDMTVRAAHAQGKWVGVCGELAADPLAVPLLVGLGVDELSLAIPGIAEVKARIRTLNLAACQGLARRALGLENAAAVRTLVEEQG